MRAVYRSLYDYCISVGLLVHGRISAFPPVSISSGHPRHAAMSAWTGRVGSGRVGLGSSLKCGWTPLSLPLSGECSGLQRMFDGFTGEEIWSGGLAGREEVRF